MSFSYERYERQQRRGRPGGAPASGLGYWLPLGLSLAAATVGFATWIWNERKAGGDSDDSDDYYDDSDPYDNRRDVRVTQNTATATTSATFGARGQEQQQMTETQTRGEDVAVEEQEDSIVSRVSGAMRRTPSPQQLFDGASKRVAAGVAAAGALVGRGLTAIRETDDDFQDHERWSAEADLRGGPGSAAAATAAAGGAVVSQTASRALPSTTTIGGKRKMVAVVVSAASTSSVWSESIPGQEVETTSILSHLPSDINHETVDLVILIYAPHLQSYPLASLMSEGSKPRPESSAASSYSNISTPAADDDRTLDLNPAETDNSSAKYDTLQLTALRLVAHPTQVLPFTTTTGHVHLLRHLSPSLVYMEESMSGLDGENVKEIEGWVGQIVIVVGGDGLADTETEDEGGSSSKPTDQHHGWWKNSNRVGLGKAEIVDSTRFTEDWERRVTA